MKKFIAICICFIFLSTSIFCGKLKYQAYADPFTVAQIGAASYAFMSGAGITFTSGSATASGMGNFMSQQVESYVNQRGGSLADVFVGQIAVDVAGKLAMTYDMYNSMADFVGWLKDKYSLSAEDIGLTEGEYSGLFLPAEAQTVTEYVGGYQAIFRYYQGANYPGYRNVELKSDGYTITTWSSGNSTLFIGPVTLRYDNNIVVADCVTRDANIGSMGVSSKNIATRAYLDNSLSWNGENYVEPTILDPSYQWLGQVGDYQDTNLDQLLGHILEDVEGNNLVVVGELSPIDPPQPTPTPMPIDPDTPLQDVPWEGLDNNLQQLYEQGLEEIGTIGDARDAITDAIGEQTGVLEGAISDNAGVVSGAIDQAFSDVQTAIGSQTGAINQAIGSNAGVVSGAIDQAVSDVQTAIGEQTAALDESLSATAEGVETIAEAIEDEDINWQKFDLRGLFPFCIPFDIYNMLNALDASPTAPHVQLPFVINSIGFSYTLDLDFSAFDPVAAIMRQMELICYGLALAWATSKVIKW